MNRFCPECGSEEGPFIKGFCKNCFLKGKSLINVKKELKIGQCKKCGKLHLRGKWIEETSTALIMHVISTVKPGEIIPQETNAVIEEREKGEIVAVVEAIGEIDNETISQSSEVVLKKNPILCDNCYKLGSDYFEAIFQLRLIKKPKAAEIEEKFGEFNDLLAFERRKNPLAETVRFIKQKNGFDAYIGSKAGAKKVALGFAKKYSSKMITSFKEMGHDAKGRMKKRFTYSVKL